MGRVIGVRRLGWRAVAGAALASLALLAPAPQAADARACDTFRYVGIVSQVSTANLSCGNARVVIRRYMARGCVIGKPPVRGFSACKAYAFRCRTVRGRGRNISLVTCRSPQGQGLRFRHEYGPKPENLYGPGQPRPSTPS